MRSEKYILDENGEPRVEPDLLTWGRWFENFANRIVAQDRIGGYFVSTVFLGLDHNFRGTGKPVLWETMVFSKTKALDGPLDQYQDRYDSRESALAGHRRIVQMLTS